MTDDGSGTADHGPADGYGLAGMRERAAVYGGWVTASSLGDHQGFQVHAMLPFDQGVLVRS